MPMSDEGVCVFEKNSRYPDKMRPSSIDHDWVLRLGFDSDVTRSDFLDGLKSIIRDYWYAERTKNSSMNFGEGELKTPISGQLFVYLSEARNINLDGAMKQLPPGFRPDSGEICIKIEFKAPRSLDDMFNSVYIDNSLHNEMNANLKKNDIIIKGKLKRGSEGRSGNYVDWRTEESPAGLKWDLGRLAVVPKSNIQVKFTLAIPGTNRGEPATYDLGSGEYFNNVMRIEYR